MTVVADSTVVMIIIVALSLLLFITQGSYHNIVHDSVVVQIRSGNKVAKTCTFDWSCCLPNSFVLLSIARDLETLRACHRQFSLFE